MCSTTNPTQQIQLRHEEIRMKFFFRGQIAIGIFIGICIAIAVEFYSDFFGANIEPSEAFVATIFGAAIVLVGTVFAIIAANETERDRQKALDEALILVIFSKMNTSWSEMTKFYRHLLESDPRGFLTAKSDDGEIRRLRIPLTGAKRPITFSHEERALAIRLDERWLFNAMNDAEGASEQILFLHELYEAKFQSLLEIVKSGQNFKAIGKNVSSVASPHPTIFLELEDLEQHMRRISMTAKPTHDAYMKDLIAAIEKGFAISLKVQIDAKAPGGVFSDDRLC